jgi:hypothetical protein
MSNFGEKIASLGDINNNGSKEIIVSSRSADKVSIHSVTAQSSSLLREHGTGSTTSTFSFGGVVTPLADQDGDNITDYAVSQSRFQNPYGEAGRVLVFSGRTGLQIEEILGRKASYQLGATMAAMTDVSGDGKADLAIGSATGYLNAGVVTTFSTMNSARIANMSCEDPNKEKLSFVMNADLTLAGRLDVSVAAPSLAGKYVIFAIGDVAINYGPTTFQGCVSPMALLGGNTGTWNIQHYILADSAGIARLNLNIPNDPALLRERLIVQAITFDAKGSLITSEAVAMQVG